MNTIKPNQSMMLTGISMMKILFLLFIFLFCGGAMAQEKTANIRNDVLSSINGNAIKKMEIVHIPYYAVTNIGISPDELEKIYLYKFVIQNEVLYPYLQSLVVALKETDINHSKIKSDLRWGIILYDSADKRIASIYLDRFGINGYMGSAPTTFSHEAGRYGLLRWFESEFLDFHIYKIKKMRKEGEYSEPQIIEIK